MCSYTIRRGAAVKSIRAVGGVVYRISSQGNIELLLMRKQGGLWTLPKGKLMRGEAHDHGLLREISEETGIIGRVEELVAQAHYVIDKRPPRPKVVTYYLVRATGGTLRPDSHERIEQVAWVPVARALARVRRRRLLAIIRAALTFLGPGASTNKT